MLTITSASLAAAFQIEIAFSDGSRRVVDFEPFLQRAQHPQIRSFLDPSRFGNFQIVDGDLIWGDYELCFPIADLHEGRI